MGTKLFYKKVLKNAEVKFRFLSSLCYQAWHPHKMDWVITSLTGTIQHMENIITERDFPANQMEFAIVLIQKYKKALTTFTCINRHLHF
jgi:hypothetical protein